MVDAKHVYQHGSQIQKFLNKRLSISIWMAPPPSKCEKNNQTTSNWDDLQIWTKHIHNIARLLITRILIIFQPETFG
jgi:hypothetical protein